MIELIHKPVRLMLATLIIALAMTGLAWILGVFPQAQLRLLADSFQINSAMLASRKDLLGLAQGERDIALLRGWRREMAGAELLAMCDGQRVLAVEEGRIRIAAKSVASVSG